MIGKSSSVIAGCFALAAFAVAVLSGLMSGNGASSVLGRALMSMIVCYPVGLLVGTVCERVIRAHVEAHQRAHPMQHEAKLAPVDAKAQAGAPGQSAAEEVVVV